MNIRNSPRRTGHLNAVSWTRQYHNRHRHTTTATITNKKTTNKVNVVTMGIVDAGYRICQRRRGYCGGANVNVNVRNNNTSASASLYNSWMTTKSVSLIVLLIATIQSLQQITPAPDTTTISPSYPSYYDDSPRFLSPNSGNGTSSATTSTSADRNATVPATTAGTATLTNTTNTSVPIIPTQNLREAVIWMTDCATDCELPYLEHLVNTARTNSKINRIRQTRTTINESNNNTVEDDDVEYNYSNKKKIDNLQIHRDVWAFFTDRMLPRGTLLHGEVHAQDGQKVYPTSKLLREQYSFSSYTAKYCRHLLATVQGLRIQGPKYYEERNETTNVVMTKIPFLRTIASISIVDYRQPIFGIAGSDVDHDNVGGDSNIGEKLIMNPYQMIQPPDADTTDAKSILRWQEEQRQLQRRRNDELVQETKEMVQDMAISHIVTLMEFLSHHDEYEYVWIVDHQLRYTGNWTNKLNRLLTQPTTKCNHRRSPSSSSSSSSPSSSSSYSSNHHHVDLLLTAPPVLPSHITSSSGGVNYDCPAAKSFLFTATDKNDDCIVSYIPWTLARISKRFAITVLEEIQKQLSSTPTTASVAKNSRLTDFIKHHGFTYSIVSYETPIPSTATGTTTTAMTSPSFSSSSPMMEQFVPMPPNHAQEVRPYLDTGRVMTDYNHEEQLQMKWSKYRQMTTRYDPRKMFFPVACPPPLFIKTQNDLEIIKKTNQKRNMRHMPRNDPPKAEYPPKYAVGTSPTTRDTNMTTIRHHHHRHEAVFQTLRSVNECDAVRLRHLVETSNRDVWVLHSHNRLDPNSEEVRKSKELIASIHGLYSDEQHGTMIQPFDTKISGSSKSSTLRAIIEKNYSYGWHVESDVFYTGNWSTLFDSVGTMYMADVINTFERSRTTWDPWWLAENGGTCYIDETWCARFDSKTFNWPTIRLSHRLTYGLLTELLEGTVRGRHEALLAPYVNARNFTSAHIPTQYKGFIALGSWGAWLDKTKQTLERLKPDSDKLYHPVKCEAYGSTVAVQTENMQRLVQKWISK